MDGHFVAAIGGWDAVNDDLWVWFEADVVKREVNFDADVDFVVVVSDVVSEFKAVVFGLIA